MLYDCFDSSTGNAAPAGLPTGHAQRLTLAMALAVLPALVGCGGGNVVRAQPHAQPGANQDGPNAEEHDQGYRSRIGRAIASTLNQLGNNEGTDEERKLIQQSLDSADAELARVLEAGSKQAILRANQRLPEVVIEPGPALPPGTELPGEPQPAN